MLATSNRRERPSSPDTHTRNASSVLRSAHVARLLAGTLIGRLPNGMVPLAILLLVHSEDGTLTLGGVLCALYGIASAIGQPLLGRLVDQHGQTCVAGTAVGLTTAALLALPAVDPARHAVAGATLVTIAGLTTPPLEAELRALWPSVLPDPEQRRAALNMDTGSQGLIYIAGPPLTVALAHALSPTAALTSAAAAGVAGTAAVLTTAPSRNWRPRRETASLLGPLHVPGLRRLFTALAGVGFALGALTVWAVEAADRQHAPWLAGVAPAALSVGSVAAGLALAHHTLPGSAASQLRAAALVFTITWLPLLTHPAPWAAPAAVLVPGAALTPLITGAFLVTEMLTPAGTVTEAYAWLIAAVGAGQAAGTALAGAAPTGITPALPAIGAAFTAALLMATRHHMTPVPKTSHTKEIQLGRPQHLDR